MHGGNKSRLPLSQLLEATNFLACSVTREKAALTEPDAFFILIRWPGNVDPRNWSATP